MRFGVKTFATFLVGLAMIATSLSAQGQTRASASGDVASQVSGEIFCGINESRDGFPVSVRLRILSVDEIEVQSTDRRGVDSVKSILKRIEIASQPKVAVFSIGGAAGVSGEAKLLLTKDALKFGEISTMMIVNQTMRESGIYQCRK